MFGHLQNICPSVIVLFIVCIKYWSSVLLKAQILLSSDQWPSAVLKFPPRVASHGLTKNNYFVCFNQFWRRFSKKKKKFSLYWLEYPFGCHELSGAFPALCAKAHSAMLHGGERMTTCVKIYSDAEIRTRSLPLQRRRSGNDRTATPSGRYEDLVFTITWWSAI